MVGLTEFGEAAWSLEQVLNTWLADQKPAGDDLRTLASEAMHGFGRWVEDIAAHSRRRGRRPVPQPAEALRTERAAGDHAARGRRRAPVAAAAAGEALAERRRRCSPSHRAAARAPDLPDRAPAAEPICRRQAAGRGRARRAEPSRRTPQARWPLGRDEPRETAPRPDDSRSTLPRHFERAAPSAGRARPPVEARRALETA